MRHTGNFRDTIKRRDFFQVIWESLFMLGIIFSAISLMALIFSILNNSFGLVAYEYEVSIKDLETTLSKSYKEFNTTDYDTIFKTHLPKDRLVYYNRLKANMSKLELEDYLVENVLKARIVGAYGLVESIFNSKAIVDNYKEKQHITVEFRSWVNLHFLMSNQSSNPLSYGLKTAIIGSLWVVFLTIAIAFPIGVGTAIFLEEYTNKTSFVSKLIQINIYNLSGVPSIVYGLFGLMFFVIMLKHFSSGQIFGMAGSSMSSRTILSASLTMSLLVLPMIIITSQQAIKAVPKTIVDASYGLGAAKYQTIFSHILPNCFDKILTGMIFALSRAIGESSPLIVVGASTFITVDPQNIFSRFTVIPIQIYQLIARPQQEYAFLSSAAIIVLLVILTMLNMTAIIMRNRLEKKVS